MVDNYYGICLYVTNMNWNNVESCYCAKTILLNGFSRDVPSPVAITYGLTTLEVTDFVAYYSLMPILEECLMLESLIINCVTFLQKSRLPEYISSTYLERKGKVSWLPRLKNFKFISCTTQGGVYNHITPIEIQGDMHEFEDVTRAAHDISRGEMEFMPFMLQILSDAKSLVNIEMTLTDIWKIPFADMIQVEADSPPPSLDISLWHFGSKRLLPIGNLLQKVSTIRTMRFNFPYHFDTFYMKLKPITTQHQANNITYQLEEVVVQQSFRWSQEMSSVDIPWLKILEKQHFLANLEYPFPLFGNDLVMANVVSQNCKSLRRVVFTGHREERELLEDFRGGRPLPWNSEWFASCDNLEELCLKSNTRFLLTPTNISAINNLSLLPQSLKHFTFHGCLDTGNYALSTALFNLINLQSFTHQARLCPWFKVEGMSIAQLQISHAMDIMMALPQLKKWTLEWCDTSSALVAHAIISSQSQRSSACISKQFVDWMGGMKNKLKFSEKNLDRQLKSLEVTIFSHDFLNQPMQ